MKSSLAVSRYVAWLVVVPTIVTCGCAGNRPVPCDYAPAVYITRHYGYSSREVRSGLIAAIWPDGQIIRVATSADKLEQEGVPDTYQAGRLGEASKQAIIARLAGLQSTKLLRQDCSADVAVLQTCEQEDVRIIECLPHSDDDLIPALIRQILAIRITGVAVIQHYEPIADTCDAWNVIKRARRTGDSSCRIGGELGREK